MLAKVALWSMASFTITLEGEETFSCPHDTYILDAAEEAHLTPAAQCDGEASSADHMIRVTVG